MKKLAIALGFALLAVGVLWGYLLRESRAERRTTAELESRLAALESGARDSSSSQGTARVPETGGTPFADGSAVIAPAGPQAAGGNVDSMAAAVRQMLNSPQGREFARTTTRMMLEERYPDLARELGLSPEEVDKLLDLMADHATDAGMDRINLEELPDRAAREDMARQLAQREQAYQGELAALLGGRYEQWKEYERGAMERQRETLARRELEQLRSAVSPAGNAVSDAQLQSLHAALDAEQKRITQESLGQSMQQELQRLTEDHRRLIDVASAHLNAQQLEGYRRHLQQQADMARMMMSAMGAAGGAQGQAVP
jgi:hypothetical protein